MEYMIFSKKTIDCIKKDLNKYLAGIGLDLVLITLCSIIFFYVFTNALPHLEVLVNQMTATGLSGELNPEFYSHYSAMLKLISFFVISLSLLFILIKGTIWKKLVIGGKEYWKYILKFTGINIIWIVLFYLIFSLYMKFVFSSVVSLNPVIGMTTANIIFYVILFILSYIAVLSYVFIDLGFIKGLKKTFIFAVKKVKTLVWNFAVLFLLILFIKPISMSFPKSAVLYLVLIILPLTAYNRIFIKEVVGL